MKIYRGKDVYSVNEGLIPNFAYFYKGDTWLYVCLAPWLRIYLKRSKLLPEFRLGRRQGIFG